MNLQPIVIDDDEIACFLLNRFLKLAGYLEPKIYLSAMDALEYLINEQNTEVTYLIFLDINMPLMDGWQFIEKMESQHSKLNYFIILITSSVNQNDKDKSLTYNRVLNLFIKPINLSLLNELKKTQYLRPFFEN